MNGRYFPILILITRMAAGTMIVPATLVAGLMTFPTTCTCGAAQPHEHALFGIAGHHHGGQQAQPDSTHAETDSADADDVNIQAPTSPATSAKAEIPHDTSRHVALPLDAVRGDPAHIPSGIRTTPDVPPPRT